MGILGAREKDQLAREIGGESLSVLITINRTVDLAG
jgi:hypothetical protein